MEKKTKYPKLPKAFKKKWVEALRSGKYKQGHFTLLDQDRNGDKYYCCLGVAAVIGGCSGFGKLGYLQHGKGIKGLSKMPKSLVVDQMCSEESMRTVEFLAKLNDDKGWGFKRIATWIEKNL